MDILNDCFAMEIPIREFSRAKSNLLKMLCRRQLNA